MTDHQVAATFMGLKVPPSPFLHETRVARIASGDYEGDEIKGALAVVRPGDRVLELGAGLGVVGGVIALNARPAALLSFEANPDLIPDIHALHALNGLDTLAEVRNAVLDARPDRPETVTFHLHNSYLGSSLIPNTNRKTRPVTVPTAAFDAVRDAFRPDVLIMDIEGGELDFLQHAELSGIRAVVLEFHPKLYGTEGMQTCKANLRRAGFDKVDSVSTRLVWTCTRSLAKAGPPSPSGGWATQIVTLDRPYVVPPIERAHIQPAGVLTEDGRAVGNAALWRSGRLLTTPPKRPQQEPDRLPGRWLWGGVLWRYFPHFVTESVTRLWALDHIDRAGLDGILFIPKKPGISDPLARWHRDFLALLGHDDLPIREALVPCRPDTLIVPGQGFGLGEISRGTDRFIAAFTLNFARDVAPDGPEKLYISRSRLGSERGALLGETYLERHLEAQGYEIFHPQAHPLAVQVARYKAACKVIAAEGSALHFFAFVGRPHQEVAMILRRRSGATRHIAAHLESFTGRAPLWVESLRRTWRRTDTDRKRMWIGEPDFASLHRQLVEGGFIDPGTPWPQPDDAALRAELGPMFELHDETPAAS